MQVKYGLKESAKDQKRWEKDGFGASHAASERQTRAQKYAAFKAGRPLTQPTYLPGSGFGIARGATTGGMMMGGGDPCQQM